MCGRYALYGPRSRYREQFGLPNTDQLPRDMPDPFVERYNIAPTQLAPIVRGALGERQEIHARWGLVPSWAAGKGLAEPINAKVETAAEKPMFKAAWRRGRVIIPASGFYEWQKTAGRKVPHYIRPAAGLEFFGFAGLVEYLDGADGPVWSYAILTTSANELMAPIHNRMPVILDPAAYSVWLDPSVTDSGLLREIAGQYPAELMAAYPVGPAVGNPRNGGPGLIQPLDQQGVPL